MKARPASTIAMRAIIVFVAALVVIPVLWTLLSSFKHTVDIETTPPTVVFKPTLDNFAYVLNRASVRGALINSIVISTSAVLIGAVFGLPCAYAVARYPTRRAADIQFFVLSLRFLPPIAVALPLMVIWLGLGLYDTRTAMIITYTLFTLSITIWLAIPAFRQVPREIEEAAFVDGYSAYAIFFRIALPVAAKSLIGAIVFSFVLVWNEFLIALMLTTSDARTLPIVASELSQLGFDTPWGHPQRLCYRPVPAAADVSRRPQRLPELPVQTQRLKELHMRALVLEKERSLALRDIDLPLEIGPRDVKIAVDTVGVCGSDVHYYTHGRIGAFIVKSPMVLGHEAAGTIVEVGPEVKSLKVGDRVCMEPGVPDMASRASRIGLYNVDPSVTFWATPPVHGCLTAYVVHPEAFTFKLPDNVSFAEGALVEPFAIGMQAASKAKIAPGDVAVVIGSGTIGIMVALAALAGGCARAIVTDLVQEKLDIVGRYPGVTTVNAQDEEPRRRGGEAHRRLGRGHRVRGERQRQGVSTGFSISSGPAAAWCWSACRSIRFRSTSSRRASRRRGSRRSSATPTCTRGRSS